MDSRDPDVPVFGGVANFARWTKIAARKPANEFELLEIAGIGPGKAAKFGEIVIEIVQKHSGNTTE